MSQLQMTTAAAFIYLSELYRFLSYTFSYMHFVDIIKSQSCFHVFVELFCRINRNMPKRFINQQTL